MVGGLLATLTAAIDELAGLDLDTVGDAELHDAVVGLGVVVDTVGGAVVPADRIAGTTARSGPTTAPKPPPPASPEKPTDVVARPTGW